MQQNKWVVLLAPIFILLASFRQTHVNDFTVLQGIVVDAQTGRPVCEAHVFIVEGEEEALINEKGEFQIKTWQKLPIQLTVVNYRNKEQVKLRVSDPAKKQIIKLSSTKVQN